MASISSGADKEREIRAGQQVGSIITRCALLPSIMISAAVNLYTMKVVSATTFSVSAG